MDDWMKRIVAQREEKALTLELFGPDPSDAPVTPASQSPSSTTNDSPANQSSQSSKAPSLTSDYTISSSVSEPSCSDLEDKLEAGLWTASESSLSPTITPSKPPPWKPVVHKRRQRIEKRIIINADANATAALFMGSRKRKARDSIDDVAPTKRVMVDLTSAERNGDSAIDLITKQPDAQAPKAKQAAVHEFKKAKQAAMREANQAKAKMRADAAAESVKSSGLPDIQQQHTNAMNGDPEYSNNYEEQKREKKRLKQQAWRHEQRRRKELGL